VVNVDVVVGESVLNQMLRRVNQFFRSRDGKAYLRRNKMQLLYPPTAEQARAEFMAALRNDLEARDRKNENVLGMLGFSNGNILKQLQDFSKANDLPPTKLGIYYPRQPLASWSKKIANAVVQVLHSDIAVKEGFRRNGLVDRVMERGSRNAALFQRAYDERRNAELRKFEGLAKMFIENEFRRTIDPRSQMELFPTDSRNSENETRMSFYHVDPISHRKTIYYTQALTRFDEVLPTLISQGLRSLK